MPRPQAELIHRKLRTAVKNAEGIALHVQTIGKVRQQKEVDIILDAIAELQQATSKISESVKRLETVSFTASQKDVDKHLTRIRNAKAAAIHNGRLRKSLHFQQSLTFLFAAEDGTLEEKSKETKRRCEAIKALGADNLVSLAITLRPKEWTAHVMNRATFDLLLEQLASDTSVQWPPIIKKTIEMTTKEAEGFFKDLCNRVVDNASPANRKRKYMDIEPRAIDSIGDSQDYSLPSVSEPRETQSREIGHSIQDKILEAAFEVPLGTFEKIWQCRSSWSEKESQSIIMTIPVEPRVASIVISVPRYQAFDLVRQFPLKEHRIDLE